MRHFIALFSLFLVFVGCSENASDMMDTSRVDNPHHGDWQDAETPPIRFVLEQTWGVEDGEPEEMLARIGRMEIDAQGNIYMLDGQAGTLASWDAEGNHRWTIAGKGEGPGEFQYAFSMVFDGAESLYVFNQSGSRLDRFTTSGEFQESTNTESFGFSSLNGIGMLDANRMVTSETLWSVLGTGVRVLSNESGSWALADSFDVDQTGDFDMPEGVSSGPKIDMVDGQIVNGHISHYQFEFRAADGLVTKTVTREFEGLVRVGVGEDGNTTMIANFSQLNTPMPVGSGYYLVEAWWPEKAFDPDERVRLMMAQRNGGTPLGESIQNLNTVDLYDGAFNLLYSLETPGRGHEAFGRILTTDDQGRIYAVTKADFPQIGRYRVEITPPE